MSRRSRSGERGVVLIAAILLVAIAASLAATLAFKTGLTARRSAATIAFDESLLVAQGAEALAAYALNEDNNNTDSFKDAWAKPYGPIEVLPGAMLEAQLEDLQGRFNLNSLIDPTQGAADPIAIQVFVDLLESLGLESKWAYLTADWIDSDVQPQVVDGGEDTLYLSQTPGYRSANLPITSVSELLALPGFGRERYLKLAPYVAALPANAAAINVCTAPGPVLDALSFGQQEFGNDAQGLAAHRSKDGCYPTRDAFLRRFTDEQRVKIQGRVTDKSQYFLLRSVVSIGTTELSLYSVLMRDGGVRPIQRVFGTE